MANKILFATHNRGKLRELRALLSEARGDSGSFELLCLDDLDPPPAEVEETGETFAENATLKARETMLATGLACVADDSGIEVDALDGRPGVRSARYADSDEARVARLLQELRGVEPARRTARFRCVVAYVSPEAPDEVLLCAGSCEGTITDEPRGENGFGYDPVFFVEELGRTFAQAAPEQKNRLSHRGKAMRALAERLRAETLDNPTP